MSVTTSESPIARILRWRKANPEMARAARLDGLRKSEHTVTAATYVSLFYSGKAQATRSAMPQYQACREHIAAIWWNVKDPSGVTWKFKNLALFIREHSDLFSAHQLAVDRWGISQAYKGLSSIRPRNRSGKQRKRVEPAWRGWTYIIARRANDETTLEFKP